MISTLKTLGIDRMSVEERIALATTIWDSIPTETHTPLLSPAQQKELENRLADHATNPTDVVPWEKISADALARFQQ